MEDVHYRYNPDYSLSHSTIIVCKSSIHSITSGESAVFQRAQRYIQFSYAYGYSIESPSTSLDYFYRQFFYRLVVMNPMFIRVF